MNDRTGFGAAKLTSHPDEDKTDMIVGIVFGVLILLLIIIVILLAWAPWAAPALPAIMEGIMGIGPIFM